jgi:energy-coupling factor transporter ATP-binding protein EcfA2
MTASEFVKVKDLGTNDATALRFPYPGLRSFERSERAIFFGREKQIDSLLSKLLATRFLLVTGASGCGKSSLVKTGLINALQPYDSPETDREWSIIEFTPGTAPVWELAGGIRRASFGETRKADVLDDKVAQHQLDMTVRLLKDGYHGLCSILEGGAFGCAPLMPPGRRVLILADQFEEVFRYDDKPASQAQVQRLIRILLPSVSGTLLPSGEPKDNERELRKAVYVVVTMRTEYLDSCAEFPELLDAINSGFAIASNLSGANLKRAIVGPAARFDVGVSKPLAERLADHAERATRDRLPLLQHALMRCWHFAREREGKTRMEMTHYENARSLLEGEALSKHADEAYADVAAEGRGRLAQILFRELTERPLDAADDGSRDTRRPRRLAAIAAVAGLEDDGWRELVPVVERFIRPGTNFIILRRGPNVPGESPGSFVSCETDLGPNCVIDISHEALIRNWRQLRDWVAAEVDDGRRLRKLLNDVKLTEERKERGEQAPRETETELEATRQWWFDPENSHRRRVAWLQRYGAGPEDIERIEGYLKDWQNYYLAEEARKRAARAEERRKRRNTALLLVAALTLFSIGIGIAFIYPQEKGAYREDFRRDVDKIFLASQVKQLVHQDHFAQNLKEIKNKWQKPTMIKTLLMHDEMDDIYSTLLTLESIQTGVDRLIAYIPTVEPQRRPIYADLVSHLPQEVKINTNKEDSIMSLFTKDQSGSCFFWQMSLSDDRPNYQAHPCDYFPKKDVYYLDNDSRSFDIGEIRLPPVDQKSILKLYPSNFDGTKKEILIVKTREQGSGQLFLIDKYVDRPILSLPVSRIGAHAETTIINQKNKQYITELCLQPYGQQDLDASASTGFAPGYSLLDFDWECFADKTCWLAVALKTDRCPQDGILALMQIQ